MKRFFLFVAALCCMGMMSVNALAEKVYVASIGLYFELDEENFSAKIVRDKSGSDNYSHLPSVMPIPYAITYNDKSYIVDVIGANAFASNTTVKEFKLPEGGLLTRIESQAFVESAVEKINIPSTVTEIPYSSFYKSALYNNDANYEDGILYIDGCLIAAKTSLEGEVTVNVGTRLIAGSAFTGCKNINHVTLPEGVTYIGCNAFNNCSALERINFPASLNFIGDNAFLNCKLREVYLKSPLTIGKMAFFATTPSIKTVVLPKGESTFEDYAFAGQPGITRINVYEKDPSKLHMGTGVFEDVDKEKCIVYVPHELNGGSVSDFKATDAWSALIIQSNNVCADGLFFELNDVTKKMTLTYELYDSYFNYCTLEENVDMVSNIHAIHALDELGYTLTSVGARAFEFASQITSITLPETVEHIGMMAFSDLNQMKEFTIPEKVNFIGEFAFSDCTGLEKITNLNPVPQDITGKSVFYNVKKTEVKLMVPPGSRTAYQLADTWGSFDIEELPIRIGDLYYYLNDEDDYAEVTYQYELSEDNYAFLPENTKLVIPSEVTYNEKTYDVRYINSGAFRNCDKIYMVEIPGSVLIVGSSAFNGCKNLWGATLNEGVKSLEMSVFEGCSYLGKVSLPSSMKQIDNYAFKGCTNLMSLLVYNPVPVAISDKVFEDVDKSQMWLCIPYGSKDDYLAAEVWNELGKEDEEHHYIVEMSNGVQVDELYYIFDKVNKTATVTFAYFYAAGNSLGNYYIIDKIPSSVIYEEEEYTVTAIGDYAFWDCYEVNMEIPAGITSIGNYAFANNNNPVTLIVNNETPIDIAGKHVFENSPQDVLFVPAGSAQAYREAEGWKDFKTIIEKGIKVGELYYHFDKDAKTAMVTYEKYEIYHDNYNSLPEELIIPEKVTYDEVEYTVTEIEQYAFRFSKSLKKVTLPATLEKIANLAFAYCEAMNEMTCYAVEPPVLGTIVFYGFDCSKIPLYVPKASIDKYKAAEQWKEFIVEEMSNGVKVGQLYYIFDKVNKTATVTYEKYKDDKNYKSLPEELIIPEKVSYDEVEYTVTAIGDYAFWSAYTSFFEIPASITSIGEYAFANISFAGMILNSEIPIDIQGKHVFENTIQELLLLPAGSAQAYKAAEGWKDFSLIIEQGIKVGNLYYSFNKEEKTATVTFEKYVNQNNYKSLPEELIIPEKVSYDEVEYTVTAIGDDAFLYCESVKKVTLPATIQKLGKEAFEHCSSISEMTCYAAEPPVLGQYAFYGIDCKSALLYVPKASIDKYENAEQWKEFVIVEMSNRVKVDELYYIFDEVNKTARVTFEKFNDENNYKSLPEELIIPENVTYAEVEYAVTAIGDDAFLYCESVKKVTLPATIQKLGKEAFEHCSSISEMTCYAAEPPVLGEDVFYGYDCSKIPLYVPKASIDKYKAAEQWKDFLIEAASNMCGDHLFWEIKDGVLTITGNGDMWNWTKGNHVPWFNYHGEITSVQLPGGLTSIGDNAFYGCESLTSIDIPASVTSIGDNAFGACKKLTSIAIPVGVTTIGTFAFDYCSELTSINVSEENEHYCDIDGVLFNKQKTVLVKYPERREGNSYTVPEGVTKLEIRAFRSADLLETIILPKGITKIEAYTFSSADLLETIILPDGLTSIGTSAFSACKKLVSIDFPASVTNIDILAFNDCIALTSVTCRAVEPPVLGTHVFDGSDCSKIPLYVPKASIDKYKAADQWKEFKIEPMETPIVIAGQKITPDMYNTMISGEGIEGDVFVTENGIFLNKGATIYSSDPSIPAIELTATDKVNKFIISGIHAEIQAPVVISGKAEVQINGALPDGIEHDGPLSLNFWLYSWWEGTEHPIELTEGAQVKLILNGIDSESNDSLTFYSKSEAIHTPVGASCDIHAGGNVDFFIQEDNCPVGYNDRTFTLHNTAMVLPYGGSVTEEGVLNAAGEEMFALRLSSNAPFIQSGKAYPIELCGVTVSEGNADDILGDGKASYDAETNTLTLDGMNVDDYEYHQALRVVKSSINVEVKGENEFIEHSIRPAIEVENGDLRIFGDKDAKLDIVNYTSVVIRGDRTGKYRVAFEGCNVSVFAYNGYTALEADSLYIDAANVSIGSQYDIAWRSMNPNKNGGLVLKHAVLKEGMVNVSPEMLFEPVPQYKVTFQDKDGNEIETQYVFEGEDAVAPEAPAVEGYTFTGWDKDFSAVKEDMVITAQYAINTFTVRFYDHSDNVISTQTVNWNEAAIEPELTPWEGHTFISWSAEFDHVKSDLDIKPIYDVEVYKVTFLGFNDIELKVEYVEYGGSATAPDAPDVEGYTFTGWDKEFDNVTSDLTVKAKYEINHYALTLVAGHGTIAITDESGEHSLNPDMIMHGTIVKLIVTADEGYQFTQWSDGNTDNPRTLVLTQDTSLVAHFEIIYLQPDMVTLCYGETYQWHDKTYDASGVYIDTLPSGVATLHLTILPQVEETIEEATICSGDTYTWQADGKEYAESGTYSVTLQDINGCDSVVILHLTVNPIATTEEHVTACDSYTWNGETYITSGEYIYTTTASNGCDSIITLHLTINNTQYAEESVVACDSYTWNGETYTESGEYVYTTTAANGCDSIVTLHLTINQTQYVEETVVACDSYTWNGQTYATTGAYTYTTTATNGCDSIVTLHLTINNTQYAEESIVACDSYTWNGQTYTESGEYVYTTTATNGCDSIVTLHLTINNTQYAEESIVACDSYTWNGQTYTASGEYVYTTNAANGCDSIVTLHLTINNTQYAEESVVACDSYTWNGETYTESGEYVYTTTATNGCDSIVTLHLTINNSEIGETEYATICHGETYIWNGVAYAESGEYSVTLSNTFGCDSIATLHLTIMPEAVTTTETVVVGNDELPYVWRGNTYSATGRYTDVEQYTHVACDSAIHVLDLTVLTTGALDEQSVTICETEAPYIWYGESYSTTGKYTYTEQYVGTDIDSIQHILNLTVNPTVYTEEHITACDSYTWNGQTYTESGDYTYTTTAANGCDSIVTLHLTINNSEIGATEYATICYGETYTWNGQTYSTEGEYSITLSNTLGCDSVATLQLTIMPEAATTTETVVIGSDELPYTWRGNTYSATGRYTDVEQYTTVACDSAIHVLDLTVLTTGNHDEQSVTICETEAPYTWYGESYSATGKYTYTEKYAGTDIDSIQHILNLTVNPTVYTEEHITACDSYEWNGQTYTQSGDYTFTTVAANGCDSIVTLHLTLNQSEHVEFSMTACDSYTWNGETYTQSGDYTYNTTTDQGCERVEVLHLTINKSEYVEESVTACDSYDWNGVVYTESGDYTYTTTTDQGCERVEVLHLTILPDATTESEELALCPSELPYEWYGQWLTEAGSYTATEQYAGMDCDSIIHELTVNIYVQTLPAAVTLPIVRTGEAIDVTIPTAEIQAHIAAETWYAPNAEVAWYIMENSDWAALTTEPVKAGTTQVVLKYAVATDCGNIESDNMVIDVIPTSVENTNSQSPTIDCQKILYEDHIYILREGKMYNAQGQKVQ